MDLNVLEFQITLRKRKLGHLLWHKYLQETEKFENKKRFATAWARFDRKRERKKYKLMVVHRWCFSIGFVV